MIITEQQKAAFDVVFKIVGHKCSSIFIAGGSVVDYEKAGDIDLWMGGPKGKENAKKVFEKFPIRGTWGTDTYEGSGIEIVGTAYVPELQRLVQVMGVDSSGMGEDHAQAVMNGFDISTHCWAYTSTGVLVKWHNATEPHEVPVIHQWRPKTFERYVKICRRYGHVPDVAALTAYLAGPAVTLEDLF